MCGIAGIIGHSPDANTLMRKMLDAIRHRGPDASKLVSLDPICTLGHNRLSIIDLDESANQPFTDFEGRFTLVYNGELYNYIELRAELQGTYPFKTQSDTEVLLAGYRHWGKECLHRFVGMFAFAIWDNQSHTLFAARDRFGVKPFYYHQSSEGQLVFASEIKALWAADIPRTPNERVWARYFTYGDYGAPHETFWSGIQQLPGGHTLEWQQHSTQVSPWYDFVERVRQIEAPENAEVAAEQFLFLAGDSIRLRFRADVPVGFNLSGGLDSSLLLGLVHQIFGNSPAIKAFHFYTGDQRYDELPWVRDMIAHTAFPLQPVRLDAAQVPKLAEQVAQHQDEPYGGIPTLAYSLIFHEARKAGTIVLLDGQGIDESLAGYDYYRQVGNNSLVQGVKSSPTRPECLHPDFQALAQKPSYPAPFDNRLQNLQYRDLFYTKIPRALRFNDRISMMHSTELREPFLDHRLLEFCFALPDKYKVHQDQGKWLARNAASGLLPEEVALAPKRPLQTPQREWLKGPLAEWTEEHIRVAARLPFFDIKTLLRTWNTYRDGNSDNSFFIWQWLMISTIDIQ